MVALKFGADVSIQFPSLGIVMYMCLHVMPSPFPHFPWPTVTVPVTSVTVHNIATLQTGGIISYRVIFNHIATL